MALHEKQKQAGKHPLRKAYFREIFRNLAAIKNGLNRMKRTAADGRAVMDIRRSVVAISDLAMIHGYEGVEKIATKIHGILKDEPASAAGMDVDFFTKVDSAVQILKEITELEDTLEREMTVERASELVESAHSKVKQYSSQITSGFAERRHKQLELFQEVTVVQHAEDAAEYSSVRMVQAPQFDIKEPDELLALETAAGVRHKTLDLFASNAG